MEIKSKVKIKTPPCHHPELTKRRALAWAQKNSRPRIFRFTVPRIFRQKFKTSCLLFSQTKQPKSGPVAKASDLTGYLTGVRLAAIGKTKLTRQIERATAPYDSSYEPFSTHPEYP
jgi:hypothetical protein